MTRSKMSKLVASIGLLGLIVGIISLSIPMDKFLVYKPYCLGFSGLLLISFIVFLFIRIKTFSYSTDNPDEDFAGQYYPSSTGL